jgi:hypothetical protein
MRTIPLPRRALGLVLGLLLAAPAAAQAPGDTVRDWLLPADTSLGFTPAAPVPPAPAPRQRIRLFRMAPGFLSDPVGLQDDDDRLPGTPAPAAALPPEPDSGPDWIQVAMGTDNPYFDFRQRGDPGGLGYYRLNTQVQLLDTLKTACTVGVQAVAPAGLQYNGMPDGPTVLSPAFALFHALDENTALQGFVGKHLLVERAGAAPAPVSNNLHYGMALQRALASTGSDGLRNLYVYVEALGKYRTAGDGAGPPAVWQVLPGLHWKLADNWWLSGGVLLPVGPARTDSTLPWQVTCSLQF